MGQPARSLLQRSSADRQLRQPYDYSVARRLGAVSHDFGLTWPTKSRLSDVTSNPNYEQFDNRSVPFAGDYLYLSSLNDFSFGTWTDWRNTVAGTDPRELPEDEDAGTADVHQCRTFTGGVWSGDLCPRDGGLDQNIYGDLTP